MYNTDFDMKRVRYVAVLKRNYCRYKNGISSWNNREYMESVYGIYTYSFEDIWNFLENESIAYFSRNNLICKGIKDRKEELYQYCKNFEIYELNDEVYIGEEYYNYNKNHYYNHFSDLRDYKLFNYNSFLTSTLIYTSKLYDLITKVAEWNGIPYKANYLYPVLKVDKEYSCQGRRQYRKRFHSRSLHYALPRRRELALSHDPEVKEYLDARDMFKGNFWQHKGIRHNRHSYIPGDWKHYYKCRKQWAKNTRNPSYEKLSKALWKCELLEEEEYICM